MTHPHEFAGPCADCGHGDACHDIGRRNGRKIRTACSHWKCPCKLFQPHSADSEHMAAM